jgi:hypothetical protein
MAEWFLFRDLTLEQDLINIQYVDSANPFGDYIIAQIEDNLGQKFDKFPFGKSIQVFVQDDDGNQFGKFEGFVVERRESDQQGQDVLEVEAYSFDQFLRQNDVSNDQSGKLISDAIKDIIQTDTPVSFNQNKIDVFDDFVISRSLQDERVETALQFLSFESGNEGFGVDADKEFFFRTREQDVISRGIDNTQWFNYDISERGKESTNEVEVRFDNGNRSVIVDNAGQKLQIQDSLGLPEPATQRARIARPKITNSQDAESEGRQFLKLKNVTLTGTITTFGLFGAEPFDIIDVNIIPRGIDSEFVITQIEYDWGRDETTLTVVENRGFDSDLFVRLAEKTERIDLRDSEPQAVNDRVVSTDLAATVTTEIDADGIQFKSTTTNGGVNKIAKAFREEFAPTTSDITFGDTATELSRSDSDMENQTSSITPNKSKVTQKSMKFTGTTTESNVKEIGLRELDGTLLARGVVDDPVSFSGTVSVTIKIDDASDNNNVITTAGQSLIRDIIGEFNPQFPTRYAYGSDQTQPNETDTSLSNQVQSANLDRTLLQTADTPEEFENTVKSVSDDTPVTIDQVNGAVSLNPVTYIAEAENQRFDGSVESAPTILSNETGININTAGEFVEFTFTLNQDVPANELRVGTYAVLSNWDGSIKYSFDGDEYRTVFRNDVSTSNNPEGGFFGVNSTKLESGTTHTLRAECTGANSGNHIVDVMFAYDDRSQFNITEPAASAFNGTTYDFPELFPEQASVDFTEINSRRNVSELELFQDWNDTSNNASVTINLGSQSKTVNNPTLNANGKIRETLSVGPSQVSRTGSIDITLSRFNDTTSSSDVPADGDGGQRVSFHNVDGDPTAITQSDIGEVTSRAFFRSGILTTNVLRESGLKNGQDLLTHSIFGEVDPTLDNVIASEQIKLIPK